MQNQLWYDQFAEMEQIVTALCSLVFTYFVIIILVLDTVT